jgi:hypothetical protein
MISGLPPTADVDGDLLDLLMPNGKHMMYCTEEVRRHLPEDGDAQLVGLVTCSAQARAGGVSGGGATSAVSQW